MELDSIWDEGFFSMVTEELDYEYDENDLFTNTEAILQGTIKDEDSGGISTFMQSNLDSKSLFDDEQMLVQAELEEKPIFENKHVLEDESFINRQNSIDSTFSNSSVKTEIERRDSMYSISDNQIIIDARFFLDSYDQSSVSSNPITNNIGSQPNSTKHDSITFHNQSQQNNGSSSVNSTKSIHSKRKKLDDFVIPDIDKKCESTREKNTVKTANKKKHISDNHKGKLKKSHTDDFYKRKHKEHTKNIAKIEKKREEILKFLPVSTLPPVDPGRKFKPNNTIIKSTDTRREEYFSAAFPKEGKKYKSGKGKTKDKLDIEKKGHLSPVFSKIDKKRGNKVDSKIQKKKKSALQNFSVHSSPVTNNKLKKRKIKVEHDVLFSRKENMKGGTFERAEFEENVKLKIDKRNTDIDQPALNKPQVSTEEKSSKVEKGKPNDKTHLPKNLNKDELPLHRKNILPIKLESNYLVGVQPKVQPMSNNKPLNDKPKNLKKDECPPGATNILQRESNLKMEPALNNVFNTKLILEKLPSDVVHSTPVHNNFDRTKHEVLDKKPELRLNFLNLPKVRVVLKKLTEEDLRSPASLLKRVKSEINENVSQKLRAQGKARNKDFVKLYCCKCKSLQMERSGLSKLKNCENCDSQLIYVCVKCCEKHYVGYNHLHRHLKKCRGSGETKPHALESIVLHRCTQCTFKTTHTEVMTSHMKSKGHKANGEIDVNKVPKSLKVRVKREGNKVPKSPKIRVKREVSNEPSTSLKIPRTRFAKLIVKQNDTSIGNITERYCMTCDKPRSSKTRKPKESCHRCKTQLHLRCLKCSLKFSSYGTVFKHLRSQCQPNEFKCAKCDYTNSKWILMQQHIMEEHANTLSKSDQKSKSKKRRREVYGCTLCDFRTYYEYNVKRHMKKLHKE